jgi:putative chitinase
MKKPLLIMILCGAMALLGLYDAAIKGPISRSNGGTTNSGSAKVAIAARNCTGIHTVATGETLGSIATKYGHTVDALAQANGLANPNLISVGQQICLPKSPAPQVIASSCSQQHTVVAGETLSSIAAKYGTTTSALASKNKLANPNYIAVGWVLCASP